MIDLHTHILPGIDDGVQDIDEALELAEMAVEGGTSMMVATPHCNQMGRFENYNTEELRRKYRFFCEVLQKEEIPLKVLPGMEIFVSEDIKDKIRGNCFWSLNDSDYYLVEFSFDAHPDLIENGLKKVLDSGKVPLIAHPERYFCVQDYPELVYKWIVMGCRVQLNKGSVFGRFGRYAEGAAHFMLENGLATCISSDAHSPFMRTAYLGDIKEYLTKYFGDFTADKLLRENPEKIINNKVIPIHGTLPDKKQYFIYDKKRNVL